MTINISIPDVDDNLHPQITVLGVGGSGGNAVNNMINSNLEGVHFAIANTDAQALQISNCKKKIQLGIQNTRGLGAGMRPDIGKQAAEETINEISEMLEGSHMLFIAAGMGGGTGTGAAPVIAKLAREKGILTVGVVTKPFHFEGSQRMKLADKGLEDLQQYVDTLLVIPNQNLFRIANEKTTFADAFKMADDVLYAGVRGVTDLMVQPGLINLDFSDVKTVMSEMGKAMMGTGEASGEGRAVAAAEAAIANPLIDDVSLKGAKGLIINITGGNDITLYEVDEAANRIKKEVDEEANIIYGTTCDERLEGLVRVSIVATGIDVSSSSSPKPLEVISTLSIDNSVYLQKNKVNESAISGIEEINLEENLELISNNDLEGKLFVDKISTSSQNLNLNIEKNTHSINSFESEFLESENHENTESENHKNSESENHENSESEHYENSESENHENSESEHYENSESEHYENSESENHEAEEIKIQEEITPSVRKLSLFDNLESDESENLSEEIISSQKSEPVFEKNIENNSTVFTEEVSDAEFLSEESAVEEEFNQEVEEELLDIPTFLRRQAN